MAMTQAARHGGQTVTIRDTETHRGDTMHYIEYEEGVNAGERRWVFAEDLE